MNNYIDITVKPNHEISTSVIMSILYQRLHMALVQLKNDEIGISLPKSTNTSLGECLRLHGNYASLHKLIGLEWHKQLGSYIWLTDILLVPKSIEHRYVYRIQPKNSPHRLRRRSIAKGWLTQEEANSKISDNKVDVLTLPYIQLTSNSTGQKFKLFIKHSEKMATPSVGAFNTYGLSKTATVPWF